MLNHHLNRYVKLADALAGSMSISTGYEALSCFSVGIASSFKIQMLDLVSGLARLFAQLSFKILALDLVNSSVQLNFWYALLLALFNGHLSLSEFLWKFKIFYSFSCLARSLAQLPWIFKILKYQFLSCIGIFWCSTDGQLISSVSTFGTLNSWLKIENRHFMYALNTCYKLRVVINEVVMNVTTFRLCVQIDIVDIITCSLSDRSF